MSEIVFRSKEKGVDAICQELQRWLDDQLSQIYEKIETDAVSQDGTLGSYIERREKIEISGLVNRLVRRMQGDFTRMLRNVTDVQGRPLYTDSQVSLMWQDSKTQIHPPRLTFLPAPPFDRLEYAQFSRSMGQEASEGAGKALEKIGRKFGFPVSDNQPARTSKPRTSSRLERSPKHGKARVVSKERLRGLLQSRKNRMLTPLIQWVESVGEIVQNTEPRLS